MSRQYCSRKQGFVITNSTPRSNRKHVLMSKGCREVVSNITFDGSVNNEKGIFSSDLLTSSFLGTRLDLSSSSLSSTPSSSLSSSSSSSLLSLPFNGWCRYPQQPLSPWLQLSSSKSFLVVVLFRCCSVLLVFMVCYLRTRQSRTDGQYRTYREEVHRTIPGCVWTVRGGQTEEEGKLQTNEILI